ncbi:MAG TPA: hypothetical protein VGH19_14270 [Verrucomicrobiae bacterium]
MTLVLDVDGKRIENPSLEKIAEAFRSIPREESKWLSPPISLLTLRRSEGNSLTTSGLPTEGWIGFSLEENHVAQFTADSPTLDEVTVISIFQRYATGDDTWKAGYRWETMADSWDNIIPRLCKILLLAGIVIGVFWAVVKAWFHFN